MVSTRSGARSAALSSPQATNMQEMEPDISNATPIKDDPPPKYDSNSKQKPIEKDQISDDEAPEEETAHQAKTRVVNDYKIEREAQKQIDNRHKSRRRKSTDKQFTQNLDNTEDFKPTNNSIPIEVLAAAEEALEQTKRKEEQEKKAIKLQNQIKKKRKTKSFKLVGDVQISFLDQVTPRDKLSQSNSKNKSAFDFLKTCMNSGVNKRISANEASRKSANNRQLRTARR